MEPEKPEDDGLDTSQDAAAVEPREPWDKLPQESQKAFGAFVLYRDDEKRRFKNVAEKLNCSPQNIFQWSSKYNWRSRTDAWDVEQDRLQRAEFARNTVRMKERHMAVARAMLNVAGHAIVEWQQRIEQGLPLHLAPEQVALLTKCAIEIESRTAFTRENKFTSINLIVGTYPSEAAYEAKIKTGTVPAELIPNGEEMTIEEFHRRQYEAMSDDEKAAQDQWRDPPKPRREAVVAGDIRKLN